VVSRRGPENHFPAGGVVLTTSTAHECEKAINLLLQSKPDQEALKKLFNVEWLKDDVLVDLNAEARALLQAER
jgi:hypothetical protein